MAIYRVFFFDEEWDMFGATGYDSLGETANEAVAKLTVRISVPIEYTTHVYSTLVGSLDARAAQSAISWGGAILKNG